MIALQASDLGELSQLTTALFRGAPGVRATRTHVATGVPSEGSRWRLRALDATQLARLQEALPPAEPLPSGATGWDPLDIRLLELLSVDGRMAISDLAEHADAPLTTVRRRLRSLLGSRVCLRCDLARPLSGWPLSAVYFASVPAERLEETSRALAGVREEPHMGTIPRPFRGAAAVPLSENRSPPPAPPRTMAPWLTHPCTRRSSSPPSSSASLPART
ncbi:Lrp/AsnC family transcriptional regulator [Streptomyces asiaticus]